MRRWRICPCLQFELGPSEEGGRGIAPALNAFQYLKYHPARLTLVTYHDADDMQEAWCCTDSLGGAAIAKSVVCLR